MAHWLSMTERTDESSLPTIYSVNWFRKGDDGSFLWPGFGENSRVLEWICRRLDGDAEGGETAIGIVPRPEDLDLEGLDIARAKLEAALAFDPEEWRRELPGLREYFAQFGDRLPEQLRVQLDLLEERLG